MKIIVVSTLLLQALFVQANLFTSEYLLTESQDNQLCSHGKHVRNLCPSGGHADHECKALAEIVKGTDVTCSQKQVCSFKIEIKSKRKQIWSFFKKLGGSSGNENLIKYSGTVQVTTNKKLNLEQKPGIIKICKENLVIVNPDREQPKPNESSNEYKGNSEQRNENYNPKPKESYNPQQPPSSEYQTEAPQESYNGYQQESQQSDKQQSSGSNKGALPKLPAIPSLDKVIPKGIPKVDQYIPKGIPKVEKLIPKELPNVLGALGGILPKSDSDEYSS